jgi:hypothetical protein
VDTAAFTPLIRALSLPFVTVDIAQRADGVRRVVELGDGQVSDRPDTMSPDTLLTAIASPAGRLPRTRPGAWRADPPGPAAGLAKNAAGL